MSKQQKLSRRDFLRMSAFTAAGAMLAACGGGAATTPTTAPAGPTKAPAATALPTATAQPLAPTTPPAATAVPTIASKYKESPALAKLVADGKLPPVDERLPKSPYVVPHKWVKTGNYGGTLNFTNSWGGDGHATIVHESMYGHSPMRWLKDGLEIGPGLVESWEANADTSEWTFKFREGLKWSDGEPFTTKDFLFWWEDCLGMNGNESKFPEGLKAVESPPDEGRSGKGTVATLKAVDDYTWQMIYDAPSPLTADRLAMWVNAGIGPRWVAPRHYLEQFHPKFNTAIKDWEMLLKMWVFRVNPDCPVLTGWKLTKYEEGVRSTWERNPYYWCIDSEGNQLPYIDKVVSTSFQDGEVEKINIYQGKSDWTHHWVLSLVNVAQIKETEAEHGCELRYWETGSGSGQSFFFNYDYIDEKWRTLIRTPKFRQALSLGFNRAEVWKNFYFNTGEPTTGTFAPKAIEYNYNDEARTRYVEWRDSFVKHDPEAAMALLDEIGVKPGADGIRTFPDGSPLDIQIVYSATAGSDTITQNEMMSRDWAQIGIKGSLTPVPSDGRSQKWYGGELMSNADWGIGDGPNHLVYPQWLVPIEAERWAPMEGKLYELRGTEFETSEKDIDPWKRTPPRLEPEEGGAVDRLWTLYDQSKVEPDFMKRMQLVWDMIKIHVEEGPFVQGSVANFRRPFLVKKGLMNVPYLEDLALGGFTDPWIHPTPAVYDPESWFWDDPSAHA